MWDYSEKVKDHYLHPRNVGEIENPDGVAEVGNIACGDALKLMFKVDEQQRIVDVKFKTFGCGSAIASASALTEMVKGKTIEEAMRVTNEDIAAYLDGLPEQKMHCSVMGREALEAAIANYRHTQFVPHEEGEERIVCRCFGVSEGKIRRVIRENHLKSVEQVTNYCKAGGGCGGCKGDIQQILDSYWGAEAPPKPAVEGRKLTNLQKIRLVEETINRDIRPALQQDGGDIELIEVEGNRVSVALRGTCAGCAMAGVTIKSYVQAKLREFVSEDLVVEEVE